MTQALLNNLNNLTEGVLGASASQPPAGDTINFDKILENKSIDNKVADNKDTDNKDTDNKVTDNKVTDNNASDSAKSSDTVNSTVLKTLGDLKENTDNKETILTVIETTIKEIAAEAAVDLNLVEETAEDVPQDEEETKETVTTDEDTITDEDSTMQEKQITLENPNAAFLLQTQFNTTVHKSSEDESASTETEDDSVITFKKTSSENASANSKNQSLLSEKAIKFTNFASKEDVSAKSDNVKSDRSLISESTVKALNIESIESGSADNESHSGNLMQNQTPQEQVVKAMIQGDMNYETVKLAAQVDASKSASSANINPSRIVDQITKQLEGMYNGSKVNIVLNPENLGKVALNILNTKDGLSAQFTVTTPEARDILMKGLSSLRDGLIAQGVSVDNVTVKLSETGDKEHHFDWTEQEGSKGGNKEQGARRQKGEEKDFEQMMFEMNENGNV